MPIINGQIRTLTPELNDRLSSAIFEAVVEKLKQSFAKQLGFANEPKTHEIAQSVIGKFAPTWVWISLSSFSPSVAGKAPDIQCGRFDITLLEGALDENFQDDLALTVEQTARKLLSTDGKNVHIAVTNLTGNVDMSVPPGSEGALLKAAGVHTFLSTEIIQELERQGISYSLAPTVSKRKSYYEALTADYSYNSPVAPAMSEKLLADAQRFLDMRKPQIPMADGSATRFENENKEWWPTHCEALRCARSDLLSGEYRDDLVYLCQDGPFTGKLAGTEIEKSWWKILSQPGVTMSWPIVMFSGEVVYFEWRCTDNATNETTAKGNVTFLRRGHAGGVYLKTEQLTFYRDVHAKFFGTN